MDLAWRPGIGRSGQDADLHWNDGTDWVGEGGTFYKLGCDYRLVVDNLMDLTHETYVHVGSIGDEAITGTPFEVSHTDHTATVTRWMINIDPPPFWAAQLGKPGKADRWQIIYFQAPSVIVGDVGVAPTGTGAPQGDRSQGVNGAFLAVITPKRSGPVITSGISFARSRKTMRNSPVTSIARTSMTARVSTTRT